jgi:hypothetical protein
MPALSCTPKRHENRSSVPPITILIPRLKRPRKENVWRGHSCPRPLTYPFSACDPSAAKPRKKSLPWLRPIKGYRGPSLRRAIPRWFVQDDNRGEGGDSPLPFSSQWPRSPSEDEQGENEKTSRRLNTCAPVSELEIRKSQCNGRRAIISVAFLGQG